MSILRVDPLLSNLMYDDIVIIKDDGEHSTIINVDLESIRD